MIHCVLVEVLGRSVVSGALWCVVAVVAGWGAWGEGHRRPWPALRRLAYFLLAWNLGGIAEHTRHPCPYRTPVKNLTK